MEVEIATWILGLMAYHLGIVIRKVALPGKDAPPLLTQLLLGIPVSIVVVGSFSTAMQYAMRDAPFRFTALMVTIAMIIEHGMVLHETASRHLAALASGREPAPPTAS